MAYNHHDMTSIVVRQEQARAQIAALSCEITLNAVKKGIKNAVMKNKTDILFSLFIFRH